MVNRAGVHAHFVVEEAVCRASDLILAEEMVGEGWTVTVPHSCPGDGCTGTWSPCQPRRLGWHLRKKKINGLFIKTQAGAVYPRREWFVFGEGGTGGGTDNSMWVLAGAGKRVGLGKAVSPWQGTVPDPGQVTPWPPPAGAAPAWRKGGPGGSGPPSAPERVLESVSANAQGLFAGDA